MADDDHALGIDHDGLAEAVTFNGLRHRTHGRGGNAARVARVGRHGVERPLLNLHDAKYFRARSSRAPSSPAATTRARLAAVAPSSASIRRHDARA